MTTSFPRAVGQQPWPGADPLDRPVRGTHVYSLPPPGAGRFSGAPFSLEAAGAAVFPLRTEVVFDTGEADPRRAVVGGTGTVLFGRYLLTESHAAILDHLEEKVHTSAGDTVVPVKGRPLSEQTWLLASEGRLLLTFLARDAKADLALFELPAGVDLPSFPCPIADGPTLALGDPVALLARDPEAGVMPAGGALLSPR